MMSPVTAGLNYHSVLAIANRIEDGQLSSSAAGFCLLLFSLTKLLFKFNNLSPQIDLQDWETVMSKSGL